MSSLDVMGEYVADLRIGDLPESAKDKLRMHLFDSIAALMVGRTTREGKALTALIEQTAGSRTGDHSQSGSRCSATLRAFHLAATMRCTEIDDIHLESCTTPGSVVVSTALALAECREDPPAPETFLAALAAGYEVVTRFGKAANGPRILYEGIWPTAFAAPMGSAATAARLAEMSAEETAHGLSSAVALAPVLEGRPEGPMASRWLKLGGAVQQGVFAALGSRVGFRSDTEILDRSGLGQACVPIDQGTLMRELGEGHQITGVSIKPYCAAKQATGAIWGFLDILDMYSVEVGSILDVSVSVPSFYSGMIGVPGEPEGRLASMISAPYQLALAAKHQSGLLDVRREVLVNDDEFLSFMSMVSVSADVELDREYPAAWPAHIQVKTKDGIFEKRVVHTKGDSTNPMSWAELVEKAGEAGGRVQGLEDWSVLAQMCRTLGTGTAVQDLLEVLRVVEKSTEWHAH